MLKEVFLDPANKELLFISPCKAKIKNPLLKTNYEMVIFNDNEREEVSPTSNQEKPLRISLQDFCLKFTMHRIKDCSKKELFEKMSRKANAKGI